MVGIIIAVLFVVLIIRRYVNYQNTIGIIALFSLVSPYIRIGSNSYDSLYFAIPVLLFAIVIKGKGKLKRLKGVWGRWYSDTCILLCIIYFMAWVLFSRIDLRTTLVSLLGIIKYTLLVYLAYELNVDLDCRNIKESFKKGIIILVVINTVACSIQLLSVDVGSALIKLYGSADTVSYLNAVTRWGFFARCFGVLKTPMELGMVMTFVFILFVFNETKVKLRYLYIILTIYCGACSASKSFWVGLIAVILIKIFTEARFTNSGKKAFLQALVLVASVVIVIILYDYIGDVIQKYLGGTFAQYWRQLSDFSEIFTTRYSEESEFLGFLPQFLKDYWLIGVGPSSIVGEKAIDSAFANVLHNGGIIALMIIIVFYIRLLLACWHKRLPMFFSMALLLVLFGFGFQTWVGASSTTFVLIYILMTLDRTNEERIENGFDNQSIG